MCFATALRASLFVLLTGACACAIAADQAKSGTSGPAAASPKTLSAPAPRPTHAEGRLVCDNKAYRLSTGTGNGTCVSGVGNGDCQDGANSAAATCKNGCGKTTGKGSCREE